MADQPKYDIVISSEEHWTRLRESEMEVIIDPMIVRSADLWLQGRSGVSHERADIVWEALSANLDSLEAFFDAFVFSERLPLVDYGITYDNNLGFESESLRQRINSAAGRKFVWNIHVMDDASGTAREAALAGLRDPTSIGEHFAETVCQELAAYEHKWLPNLGLWEGILQEEQKQVARFQYGLLLFGEFAHRANVGHLVQANRSRLWMAGALHRAPDPDYELDDQLRRKLKEVIEDAGQPDSRAVDLDPCPSFLPLLLSERPRDTREFLDRALRLRDDPDVAVYRKKRQQLACDWRRGYFDPNAEDEMREITRAILGIRAPDKSPSDVQVGLTAGIFSLKAPLELLRGWLPIPRPERRHLKLLMRSMREARAYVDLRKDVYHLWNCS